MTNETKPPTPSPSLREALEREIDLAIGPCDCEPGLSEGEPCAMHKAVFAALRGVAGLATALPGSEPIPEDDWADNQASECLHEILDNHEIYVDHQRSRILYLIARKLDSNPPRLNSAKTVNTQGSEVQGGGDQ